MRRRPRPALARARHSPGTGRRKLRRHHAGQHRQHLLRPRPGGRGRLGPGLARLGHAATAGLDGILDRSLWGCVQRALDRLAAAPRRRPGHAASRRPSRTGTPCQRVGRQDQQQDGEPPCQHVRTSTSIYTPPAACAFGPFPGVPARYNRPRRVIRGPPGAVAEWPKALDLKSSRPARASGVRILPAPLCPVCP